MNPNKGFLYLADKSIYEIFNHQYIANILAETNRCYNYLQFKLVPRQSMGNQNVNAFPKITLNGFNILLEFTYFTLLSHL